MNMPSKYKNKKIEIRGIKFDSKKEGYRYLELLDLQNQGKIQNLELQKTYRLTVAGHLICKYNSDFDYDLIHDGYIIHVTEDVKSPPTRKNPTYRIKNKLFRACQGYDIKEV
tara:strand:- start:1699 stop:2034 length:336 start_codon:yes stop_codon:yes gene_type:complete